MIITETDRLILREFELSDAQSLFELNNDVDVMRYTGDAPFKSIQAAYQFLKSYRAYDKSGFGRWAVVLKDSGDVIGWCGLKRHNSGMVDLGFRLLQSTWDNGYATEAGKASLTKGFNHFRLTQIVGRAAKANESSIKVLKKLGMTYWKDDRCEGIDDAVYYSITADQFERLNP